MQQVQATSPYPYYYYMPVQMEGDQQQGVPMAAYAVETPEPEIVQPKEETKDVKECDTENQKKKRKPKFKKLSGCQKFFVVIGVLSLIGFCFKLLGVGIGLTVLSHMYHSCENPPHSLERQWATNPTIASNIRVDITSAMVHVRTCPHAKSIMIHTSSRSKNPEDLNRMIPAYHVMDGTISLTAKFPAFDFDTCASVKVDIVVPESLASPANLFVKTETGVVYVLPNKHKEHQEHHEKSHHGFKNATHPVIFNNIDISTKAGHVEVARVYTRGTINAFSKIGGVTLKGVTASFLTGSTLTGFVNVEHVRVGQLTALADSGSVTVSGVVFEEKPELDTYFLQASIDLGNLEVKRIWNKLNADRTAVVTINSGSGHSEVKLSKKANLKFAVSTVSGDIELHGKDLPKLIADTEVSKTGRIEGHGALTDVTVSTSSGRTHLIFRDCKKHNKDHGKNDEKHEDDKPTDAEPTETTTEHDKPKIHPHHTKPHKPNHPVTGGMHEERPHRTQA